MNPFFPVSNSPLFEAYSDIAPVQRIPAGGPIIRITRDTSTSRVFIKFGGNALVGALNNIDMMELVSGVVEELENPDGSLYDRFYLYSDAAPGVPVPVQISTSPTFERTL